MVCGGNFGRDAGIGLRRGVEEVDGEDGVEAGVEGGGDPAAVELVGEKEV